MAKTLKDFFGIGYTTRRRNGTTYHTTKHIMDDGYTTYGSDGSKYTTTKDFFDTGYTTRGNDGSKYTTTKDLSGTGYTTHGTDGSKYTTHKNLFHGGFTTHEIPVGAILSGIGTGLALFAVVFVFFIICSKVLTAKSYIYLAGVFILPGLSSPCENLRISTVWCPGLLFCFAAFGMINSFHNDISVVAGTSRSDEGLIVLIILFLILLLCVMFAIFALGESGFGLVSAGIILISLAWSYLDAIHSIGYTKQMQHYVLGILAVFAAIDQILLLVRKE